MVEIAASELCADTRRLLLQVELGDEFTITVDGRPVAFLLPVAARQRWMNGPELLRLLSKHQADPAMDKELTDLTTDDPL
jgi:prevent-host-death family protein